MAFLDAEVSKCSRGGGGKALSESSLSEAAGIQEKIRIITN